MNWQHFNLCLVISIKILLVFTLITNAYSATLAEALNFSKMQKLSDSYSWKHLIHFEENILSSKSSITDSDFFIASNGSRSPQAEIESTLSDFFNNPSSQCRFPARKLWLEHSIPNLKFPNYQCQEYLNYIQSFKSSSVSLIYASGYLGNPASMYGHVFLKFSPENEESELLDNTFSFGAQTNSDNKIAYIYKGITGGYQGRFANQKFHHQSLRYNQTELRDLWEYKLSLTPFQIELLLAHLWELDKTDITYYFFRENCAYQIANLLNVVIEPSLLPEKKAWVMPFDIVAMLNKDSASSYIDKVIYHSSRQEDLNSHFQQLNDEEKEIVFYIIERPSSQTLTMLNKLQQKEQKRIIDTLYDYYSYLKVKNDTLTAEQIEKRKLILTARFGLPSGESKWNSMEHVPPHRGQNTTLLQVSPFYNSTLGSGIELRIRANYYDLLSVNAARVPFSELSSFDLTLYKTTAEELSIRQFDLLKITNLNISQTGLPEDQSPAWGFSVGYKPSNLSCSQCSSIYTDGFYGKGFSINDGAATYVALSEEIQIPSYSNLELRVGPEVGGVFNITPNWATVFKASRQYNLKNVAEYQDSLSWEQRFFNNPNFDIRTSVDFDGNDYEYAINLTKYW
jgi:hypothetical protein